MQNLTDTLQKALEKRICLQLKTKVVFVLSTSIGCQLDALSQDNGAATVHKNTLFDMHFECTRQSQALHVTTQRLELLHIGSMADIRHRLVNNRAFI